ncbi:MAG: hypothetical protein HOW73_31645 [Polyangiaceae bacterium]|nr:hypothetical protein [Polyangiaceae bacterium]
MDVLLLFDELLLDDWLTLTWLLVTFPSPARLVFLFFFELPWFFHIAARQKAIVPQ